MQTEKLDSNHEIPQIIIIIGKKCEINGVQSSDRSPPLARDALVRTIRETDNNFTSKTFLSLDLA